MHDIGSEIEKCLLKVLGPNRPASTNIDLATRSADLLLDCTGFLIKCEALG